ncbi:hypothetical protein EXIGLDRAFT_701620 [Exidia glandulosa HHB12029]|uniref:Uncharacterized protein n=1 Tax=Exidia glandulosa HHB12029 TaxID=1314781 RepID=A0A165Q3B6_EXIGL|nr:hypothetical protein EXIGLDRAFT_701620 [Exidia glandulosa HHB12029]
MLPVLAAVSVLLCAATLSSAARPLTNAQRFAAGLPPAKPRYMYGSRTRRDDGAQPSQLPPLPVEYGYIEVLNAAGSHIGWLSSEWQEASDWMLEGRHPIVATSAAQAHHYHFQPERTAGRVDVSHTLEDNSESFVTMFLIWQLWATQDYSAFTTFTEAPHAIHPQPDPVWWGDAEEDQLQETQIFTIDQTSGSMEVGWDNSYAGDEAPDPFVRYYPLKCLWGDSPAQHIWGNPDPDAFIAYLGEWGHCEVIQFRWRTATF